MISGLREILLRATALIGLGTSALLLAEYRTPSGALCGAGGGCDLARHSPYAELLGVPLPVVGVMFFGMLLLAIIAPPLRRWLRPLSAAGALAGFFYTGVQAFVLGAYCALCLVVDLAAVATAALAFAGRDAVSQPARVLPAAACVALAVIAVAAPLIWQGWLAASFSPSAVPAAVLREQRPGRVTVVEFVDFECPACRAQYAQLEPVLDRYRDEVSVVFKHLPLPQHQNAADAARAFCCAEEGGVGREMAGRLFRARRLRRGDCEEIAVGLGLDREEFRRCVDSDRVARRLHADRRDAAAAGVRGLPTFWIGEERFEGVHESEALSASIERALRGGHKAGRS